MGVHVELVVLVAGGGRRGLFGTPDLLLGVFLHLESFSCSLWPTQPSRSSSYTLQTAYSLFFAATDCKKLEKYTAEQTRSISLLSARS